MEGVVALTCLLCCVVRVYLYATHTLNIATTHKPAKMETGLYKMKPFFWKWIMLLMGRDICYKAVEYCSSFKICWKILPGTKDTNSCHRPHRYLIFLGGIMFLQQRARMSNVHAFIVLSR